MVRAIKGNLLDSTEDFMVQQCNCITNYPKGLAKTMFQTYPEADTYTTGIHRMPGTIHVFGRVVNLYGQVYPGRPRFSKQRASRIRLFQKGLDKILELAPSSVAFPHRIGCGLAGGDWKVYSKMIRDFETRLQELNPSAYVTIYHHRP